MKITVNEPPPVVTPPKTYIFEFSQEEVDYLRYIVTATAEEHAPSPAARRFISKTNHCDGGTFSPQECFL